jgi:uncharacterized protein DUF6510
MSDEIDMGSVSGMSGMSGMSDEPFRLDGNAAAGVLEEIFTFEVTSAQSTCAGCGRTAPLGALLLYGGQMGIILRCPACERVELRVACHGDQEGQYWIDMRGMTTLRIGPDTTT